MGQGAQYLLSRISYQHSHSLPQSTRWEALTVAEREVFLRPEQAECKTRLVNRFQASWPIAARSQSACSNGQDKLARSTAPPTQSSPRTTLPKTSSTSLIKPHGPRRALSAPFANKSMN